MKQLATVILSCLVWFAAPAVVTAQDARSSGDEISQISKELSDLQSLETLSASWRDAIRDPGDMLNAMKGKEGSDDPAAAWRKAVDKTFDVKGFATRLARAQAEGLDANERRELVAFRSTAVGRGLTAAETRSPFPPEDIGDQSKAAAALAVANEELKRQPARRKLLDQLAKASGGVAIQVELMMGLARGVAVGAVLSTPAGRQRPSTDDVLAMVEKGRPAMAVLLSGILPGAMQLTFRNIGNSDLAAYVSFLKTSTGRKNNAIVTSTFTALISAQGVAIGEAFAKELEAKRL